MGTLRYDKLLPPIALPDRALEHIHIVIARKLREQQAFAVTIASGVTTPVRVWIDARVPIVVTYAGKVGSSINRRWIAELEATFSNGGFSLVPEPAEA